MLAAPIFGVGECLHGPTQGALVADMAPPQLRGRYMALSSHVLEIGFVLGPAIGGLVLALEPIALWPIAAGRSPLAGVALLALERRLPPALRRTPVAVVKKPVPAGVR